ncbi:MAG: flippase, partial [Deltaproteobacteria bacterium]
MPVSADAPPRRGGNLGFLGISQVVRVLSGLAINVMLMRWLGVDGFGIYGYVATLVGVLAFGSHLGLNKLLKREIARDESRATSLIPDALLAVTVSSLLTGLVVVAWSWGLDGRPSVVLASALAAVALMLRSQATVVVAAFHAVRRMALGVGPHLVGRLVLVAATAGLLALRPDVVSVFVAQLADGLVTLLLVLVVFHRRIGRMRRPGPASAGALARESIPFSLHSLFGSVYLSIDVILLQQLRGEVEVGIYRAAAVLIGMLPLLAETLNAGIFPRMARHLGDRAAAGRELRFAARILLVVGVPIAVGGMLLAEPLMVLLGGEAYAPSAAPFVLMAPLLPLRYLNNGFGMTLSSLNRQPARTRGVLAAALFNLGTNLVAIPLWGAMGAAATTLLTELLLTTWYGLQVRPLVDRLDIGSVLVRLLPATVAMTAVLRALPALP